MLFRYFGLLVVGATFQSFCPAVFSAPNLVSPAEFLIAQFDPSGVSGDFLRRRPDFFEEGLDRMEDEILRLEDPKPDPIIAIDESLLQWQPMVFREAGFGVWIPHGVMSEETELLETEDGELTFDVLASNIGSSRFLAAYSQLTDSQLQESPEVMLQQVRDGIVDRTDFALANDSQLMFSDVYPGREFLLEGENERITFRAYAIGSQIILLAGRQPTSQQDTEAIGTYLNSFTLLK